MTAQTKLTGFKTANHAPTTTNNASTVSRNKMTQAEFREAVEEYAAHAVDEYEPFHCIDLDEVDIRVSDKMVATAGKAIQKNNDYSMKFSFKAYEEWGWGEDIESIIRHELIHIVQFIKNKEVAHGKFFQHLAAKLDVTQYCDKFTDYNYLLVCSECGDVAGGRYKKSKLVKDPANSGYQSRCCSATLESREA